MVKVVPDQGKDAGLLFEAIEVLLVLLHAQVSQRGLAFVVVHAK